VTVISQEFGYLESNYLEDPYLTGLVHGHMGFQATIVIETETPEGMQAEITIADQENPVGVQAEIQIVNYLGPQGMQAQMVITSDKPLGFQALMQILNFTNPLGAQANISSTDFENAQGIEARIDDALIHRRKQSYLVNPYLTDAYLVDGYCVNIGMQAEIQVFNILDAKGMQGEITIADFEVPNGFQAEMQIDTETAVGMQSEITIQDFLNPVGMQAEMFVKDFLEDDNGWQGEIVIADFQNAQGFQATLQTVETLGFQVRVAIYNSKNLRILCEFPSRGVVDANWTANSTATGDFDVNNVNTDIVEQVWRSATATITGVQLVCDTGLPQGVAVDTVALLGTNLTTSADITMEGSSSPIFATIDRTILMTPLDNGNVYHISETLPLTQQRYWRISIDDATNSNGFLEIGVILFGASDIFQGECATDQITLQKRDFTKTVRTEGHTNVANSRAQKRVVGLQFRSLDINGGNYDVLAGIFESSRTVLKCLWIPTPNPTRPDVTDRYAVFAKLTEVPVEQHNNKGADLTFINFSVNLDESL
jgi:hypothetical protein